ncbi:MAG TPA: Mur ligase domain-containing protein [Candidatus Paceibacterota bacterium]|nr:Mur ligase domain-containing protein [Candidatus Paceibacterota bacterium]
MLAKRIYIVGIGGIGLSALAQLLRADGCDVSGSDRGDSPTTELLRQKGIEVFVGHDAAHIPQGTELLIYSDAIPAHNPERAHARDLGIPEMSYFETLGKIANEKKVIAVSGAHGKTTTTAMLIDILEDAGLDPTAVVGSLRAKTKTNFRAGAGEYFVVEADEYLRHFLNFDPLILVITNIDADHLDYYRDLADIQSAFRTLAQKVPANGFIICDPNDEKVKPALEGATATIVDYTAYLAQPFELKVLPFNKVNAAPALGAAVAAGVSEEAGRASLSRFAGTWRRFEYKGTTTSGALLYDDYGHHPTEIKATLRSVKEQFPGKKLIVAFHPHLYSRTKKLFGEFAEAFDAADRVFIAPIFAAREPEDPTISSEMLAEALRARGKDAAALASLDEVTGKILEAKAGAVFVTMGAGDIYKAGEAALKRE